MKHRDVFICTLTFLLIRVHIYRSNIKNRTINTRASGKWNLNYKARRFGRIAFAVLISFIVIAIPFSYGFDKWEISGIPELSNGNIDNVFIFEENWKFDVQLNGSVIVSVSLSSLVDYTICCYRFYVPQTAQDFSIVGDFSNLSNGATNLCDCKAYSFEVVALGNINISYNWPDGAIYYDNFFYFAGEENPPVASLFSYASKDISFEGYNIVNILLPESVFNERLLAIDFYGFEFEHNKTLENNRLKIRYKVDSYKQCLPIIKYQVENPFQIIEFDQKNSSNFIVSFHPSTVQWMETILGIAEKEFEELEKLLEYTPTNLPITIFFVPVGSEHDGRIIGEDVPGLGGHGKVIIRGDYLFGVAENKEWWTLDTFFHEIVHCFQPLHKNPPDFFSEGLATLLSAEIAGMLNFTEVAKEAKERIRDEAFDYEKERKDYSYIWMWDFIDVRVNKTIRKQSYCVSARIWEETLRITGFELLKNFYKEICDQNVFNDPALSENTKWCYFVYYLNSSSVIDITSIFQEYELNITTNLKQVLWKTKFDHLIYYCSLPLSIILILITFFIFGKKILQVFRSYIQKCKY